MLTRQKLVDIKLTGEWLGHPSGSLLKVDERRAKQMEERGVAMIMGGNDGKQETAKKESAAANQERKEEISSKIQRRDKDKMIKSSNTK